MKRRDDPGDVFNGLLWLEKNIIVILFTEGNGGVEFEIGTLDGAGKQERNSCKSYA